MNWKLHPKQKEFMESEPRVLYMGGLPSSSERTNLWRKILGLSQQNVTAEVDPANQGDSNLIQPTQQTAHSTQLTAKENDND
jgi:hypothetical protein